MLDEITVRKMPFSAELDSEASRAKRSKLTNRQLSLQIQDLPPYNKFMPKSVTATANDQTPQSGVDKSLLVWMASKTPQERLETLQGNVNAFLKARNGRREN